MPRATTLTLSAAALLLGVVPYVVAHGEEQSGDVMEGMQDAPKPAPENNGHLQSYWSYPEHAGLMYMHVALMVVAWIIVLPVCVMFSIARSRLCLPTQFVFLVVNAFGLLIGIVYDHKTPDLYPNNSHNKIGWMITWVASAWVLMGLLQAYTTRSKDHAFDSHAAQPVTAAAMAQYQRVHNIEESPYRYSNDSGQGTERNSSSLYDHSRSPSVESENQQFAPPQRAFTHEEDDSFDDEAEKRGFLKNSKVDRFLSRNVPRFAVGKTLKALCFLSVAVDRVILLLGFLAVTTGTVVYGGIARGDAVFNILAHYIKGGIFFWYGLLTLGRWMGAFADFGWAWNVKPPKEIVGRRRAAIPSAEFTESFVIFLYGASNVFLEHLAAWGDEWTAQDLEHVSISILFFGGGLLGMIIESRKLREFLNTSILSSQASSFGVASDESWAPPKSYRFSMNPLPGLVILLLGMMMGSHHQSSMLSTMVHKQWGGMFVGFALARAITYILLYLSPPTSYLPSRPPSEIITAFCLLAGGITFMVSNKDTVAALESYDLDAMFTFTVTVGFTALLMAWTTVLIAIKGWAATKERSSYHAKQSAGALA